jgi:hypothetical protein
MAIRSRNSSERGDNLADLMGGLAEANDRMRDDGVDPMLKAAAAAFGFIAQRKFIPGMVFRFRP